MMKSSEISNENVSCGHTTLKMDNMDMLANILRLLSGREAGLDLHLFWHAGDHHLNHILSPFLQLSRPYQQF